MCKTSAKLAEENNKIKKWNLDLKEYIKFVEESNKTLTIKVANIRNLRLTCETFVSLKKEVPYLYESKMNSLNKRGLRFKPDRDLIKIKY